jgi:hypothetical protein
MKLTPGHICEVPQIAPEPTIRHIAIYTAMKWDKDFKICDYLSASPWLNRLAARARAFSPNAAKRHEHNEAKVTLALVLAFAE